MKRILTALVFVFSAMLTSCDKGWVCTDILNIVSVVVEDSTGKPAVLDEVYTIRQSSGEKITYPGNALPGTPFITVIDDTYHPKLKNNSDIFLLVGIIAGVKVLEEPYMVSADRCHIQKRSGKERIVIK